jgi:DNA polymerase kappa
MTPEEAEEVLKRVTQSADDDTTIAPSQEAIAAAIESLPEAEQHSLKHHLLGPSLTKAGQDGVDQKKVSEIIYEASKGSKFFNNEEKKDKNLTARIEGILKHKAQLEKLDLKHELRRADDLIASLELSRDLTQYVVHIDCDAFYAAVEEIDRPELKDVPMAVGQGVLTTCNYEARKYGCRSAMAGFVAKKLCPQLICLPLNFDKYTAKAREVRAIFEEYDPRYESSSIDEAYLNITEYCETHEMDPESAIQQLREEVHDKCKITISAGIAPNAKIAKICSNKNKPNGQFRVPNDRAAVAAFMKELPVRKVNGVGRVLERELDAIGVKTCGDLYRHRAYLNRLFGQKTYEFLLQTYLGLGRTDIHPADDYERKSVGTESTFRDISTKDDLRAKLRHTAEELEKDMARVEVKGRTLCLKVKLHTYEVFTRQICPPKAVSQADDLYNFSLPMLAKLEKDFPGMKLRLMGLRCTHLISTKKDNGAFFKPRIAKHTSTNSNGNADENEWEVWPDSEFEEAARQEKEDEMEEMQRLSQEHEESGADWHEPFGRYKFNSAPPTPDKRQQSKSEPALEETWECPICTMPQPANDRDFNSHIDLCLSRQTIKDVVAEAVPPADEARTSRTVSPDIPTRPRSAVGKRKASTIAVEGPGPRQKKLFFA